MARLPVGSRFDLPSKREASLPNSITSGEFWPIERRERVWSLIVKLLHFANVPQNENSVGQRNDHYTGSNKVE